MKLWKGIDRESLIFVILVLGGLLMLKFIERQALIGVIERSLPPREAQLLSGMVWGENGEMNRITLSQLRQSGLIHLVIVSGSNVMLLVGGLIEVLAGIIGRKKSIILGMAVGWWYANIVGGEIPVIRAMLMVTVLYSAQLLGRKFEVFRGLTLIFLIMVVAEVKVLTSISFWLSMAAYVGVLTKPEKVNQTIWISLWTTPIIAMYFGKISLVSPLTNMLVIGGIEIITGIGMLLSVGGLFVFEIARWGWWLLLPMLRYFSVVAEWGSGDWAIMEVNFNSLMLGGWYLGLISLTAHVKEKVSSN